MSDDIVERGRRLASQQDPIICKLMLLMADEIERLRTLGSKINQTGLDTSEMIAAEQIRCAEIVWKMKRDRPIDKYVADLLDDIAKAIEAQADG